MRLRLITDRADSCMTTSNPNRLRAGARVADPAAPARTEASPPRQLRSDELFAGAVEVLIEHQGSRYRLRRTSRGKLILTK